MGKSHRRILAPRWLLLCVVLLLGALAAAVLLGPSLRRLDLPDRDAFDVFLGVDGRESRSGAAAPRASYAQFEAFLTESGVGRVVPVWHLWRQGDEWRRLGEPPFAVPPRARWPEVVPTLVLLRDEIIPALGPIEVVSGFRTERYNRRAGGAHSSRHLAFDALDVIPRRFWTSFGLSRRLLSLWRARGPALRMGLGLYGGTRFHIDTHRFRRW